MIKQNDGEARIDYLLRVLSEFMSNTVAGSETIDYDETTCDGLCLAEDIAAELGAPTPPVKDLNSVCSVALLYQRHDGSVIKQRVHSCLVGKIEGGDAYDYKATAERYFANHETIGKELKDFHVCLWDVAVPAAP